jgi:hypothetical protein
MADFRGEHRGRLAEQARAGNCQLDFLNMPLDWICGLARR